MEKYLYLPVIYVRVATLTQGGCVGTIFEINHGSVRSVRLDFFLVSLIDGELHLIIWNSNGS